jgi:hypothetical protein
MAVRNRAPGFDRASAERILELLPKAASIGSNWKRSLRFMACLASGLGLGRKLSIEVSNIAVG